MENIGDLLFYLLAGLFAIVGVISRSKKGKSVLFPQGGTGNTPSYPIPGTDISGPERTDPGENEMESILSDDTLMEEVWVEPMEASDPDVEISQMEIKAQEFVHEDTSDGDIADDPLTGREDNESIASTLAASFNLPEAIVWSEILNRKDNF